MDYSAIILEKRGYVTSQTLTNYPSYKGELKKLVRDHRMLADEPLLLAIYYNPRRKSNREQSDIFLFEVIENFGGGGIDPDRELFEVTYGAMTGFPLEGDQRLHLLMTNPRELETAVREKWKKIDELKRAIKTDDYTELYSDAKAESFKRLIYG